MANSAIVDLSVKILFTVNDRLFTDKSTVAKHEIKVVGQR